MTEPTVSTLESILDAIPVHYADVDHFVAGNRGASEWTLTATTVEGKHLELRGCDLSTFRDGPVTRKDTFWKVVGR